MNPPLAIFTPSLVDPGTLERLFVAREPVLADLVARASKAMTGGTRAHRLLVGPRGAGKTHLLSLAHDRISRLEAAPSIAWLAEDPWMIDGYADLLREIVGACSSEDGEAAAARRRRMSADALENEIRALAGKTGPVVVLAENFDRILEAIDGAGQRRLRRFMENDRALLLLVTATRLTADLLRQDGPFYGFFSTFELEPLTVDQATDMLVRIAEYRGNDALEARLRAGRGTDRYRLAAIDALAGGQPRVWALLASALTLDGLDSLADVLLTRFDDLTPYYQEQLGRLSPRERKVVRTLAELDRALNVKELAEALDVDQRSLAKTASTLRQKGWLAEVPIPLDAGDARKTHFELAEPLARLAFQLKDNRGEAIPLLVTFLSAWFSHRELGSPLERASEFVRRHLDAAFDADGLHAIAEAFGSRARHDDLGLDLTVRFPGDLPLSDSALLELDDALGALSRNDPAPYLTLPSAKRHVLRSAIDEHGLEGARRLCIGLGSKSAAWLDRAERLAADGAESIRNRTLVALLYDLDGQHESADVLFDDVVRECMDEVGPEHPLTLSVRLAQLAEASIPSDPSNAIEKFEALLADSMNALGAKHPLTGRIRLDAALSTARIDYSRALSLVDDEVSALEHPPAIELILRAMVLSLADAVSPEKPPSEVFEALLAAVDRLLGRDDRIAHYLRRLVANRAKRTGNLNRARDLLEEVSRDQIRTLGRDHPDTVDTLRRLEEVARLAPAA